MRLDFTEFPKQFLLLRRDLAVDAGARHAEFAGWRVQAAPSVPLVVLQDGATGAQTGLLIGWAIHRGRLLGHGETLVLDAHFETEIFPMLSGRFTCLWQAAEGSGSGSTPAGSCRRSSPPRRGSSPRRPR
jgi:hypothetical protein